MKLLAALAVVLLLAGCSAEAPPEHPAEAASETASESGSGEHATDEPVAFPPGFPTDRVPLFDGTLLHVAHPGNLWAAWIESADLVADLAAASQLLLDAGFTQTAGADGWGDFTDGDRSLRIIASVDATYGSSLQYTITDGAVEAEPDAPAEAPAESEH